MLDVLPIAAASPAVAVFVRSGVDVRKVETDYQGSKTAGGGEVTYSLESIVDAMGIHADRVNNLGISFVLHGCRRTQGLTAWSADSELRPRVSFAGKVGPGYRIGRSGRKLTEPPFVYGTIRVEAKRALNLRTSAEVQVKSLDPRCAAVVSVTPTRVEALVRWFQDHAKGAALTSSGMRA